MHDKKRTFTICHALTSRQLDSTDQRIAICARSDDGGEKCVGGGQVRAKPTFLDGNVVCAEEEAKKGQRAQRFLEPYTEIREGVEAL